MVDTLVTDDGWVLDVTTYLHNETINSNDEITITLQTEGEPIQVIVNVLDADPDATAVIYTNITVPKVSSKNYFFI